MSEASIDIYRITEVNEGVIEATRRLVPALDSGNQATISAEYLEKIVDSPNTYWLAAASSDSAFIHGMATLTIMPMMTNVRATLENVVVDRFARGMGIGTALCTEARRIADENGANTLRAAASRKNISSLVMLKNVGFAVETSMHYLELDIQQGPRF